MTLDVLDEDFEVNLSKSPDVVFLTLGIGFGVVFSSDAPRSAIVLMKAAGFGRGSTAIAWPDAERKEDFLRPVFVT